MMPDNLPLLVLTMTEINGTVIEPALWTSEWKTCNHTMILGVKIIVIRQFYQEQLKEK